MQLSDARRAFRAAPAAVAEGAASKHNATEAEVDNRGDVWVVVGGHGHWLDKEDLMDLAEWIERETGQKLAVWAGQQEEGT